MHVAEKMRKDIVLILCLCVGCVRAKFYKKLAEKKIKSDLEFYCKKKHGCKVFNYNTKLQICQLTDRDTNHNHKDAVPSGGWEVYIPIIDQVMTCYY